jgi:membrane protein DedA with SNARE-associated domain
MDRDTLLWALVLFFGASLLFSAIREATEGESVAVRLGFQVLALAVLIAAVVAFVRRRNR